MRIRLTTAVLTALAAALSLGVAGPSVAHASTATVTTTSTTSTTPVVALRDGVLPGPGWYLAIVSKGNRSDYGIITKNESLELVDPAGTRHVLYTHPVNKKGYGYFSLVDWSPDGHTALLLMNLAESTQQAVAVDVTTGVVRTVTMPAETSTTMLAPDGSGLLMTGYGDAHGSPASVVTWAGVQTPITEVGGKIIAIGTTSILNATPGRRNESMTVTDTTTHAVVRTLATPGVRCDPVRSWDATQILVSCYNKKYVQSLSLIDPVTGAMTKLSKRHPVNAPAYGDLDARQVPAGLFLQIAGPCGVVYVAKQRTDGSLKQVLPKKAVGNLNLIGTEGDQLVVQHAVSCDGPNPRSVLARYNPATNSEQVIVELGGRESLDRVLPFGERQASLY